MNKFEVFSFAKINLSIDVRAAGEDGYHEVDMIMQHLSFHDTVKVEYEPYSGKVAAEKSGSFDIEVKTNRSYLPCDERNLAFRAAKLMAEKFCGERGPRPGKINIDILKRIPVAGGLAGGSGNAAAVIHALNYIWKLGLSLDEILELSAELGSDVPFCAMGQAKGNRSLRKIFRGEDLAATCARAKGRGTVLTPVAPFRASIVIAKPRFSVSTAEVYKGIDSAEIDKRPDNDRLESLLGKREVKPEELFPDFVNVLENYTLKAYPKVSELKEDMLGGGALMSLMSGSGPTVFGIFSGFEESRSACEALRKKGYEAYWTRTIW